MAAFPESSIPESELTAPPQLRVIEGGIREQPVVSKKIEEANFELWQRMQTAGEPEERLHWRNEILERNYGLVTKAAAIESARGRHWDEETVLNGSLGLIKAVETWDPEKGSLSNWAIFKIIGEFRHFDRLNQIYPSTIYDARPAASRAFKELQGELGRKPTASEIVERSGLPLEMVKDVDRTYRLRPVSFDDTPLNEAGSVMPNFAEISSPAPDFAEEAALRATVDKLLGNLEDYEEDIVRSVYIDQATQAEAGLKYGLSQVDTSKVLRRALERLTAFAVGKKPPKPLQRRLVA